MKKIIFISIIFLFSITQAKGQTTTYEYLTVNVIYGIKTSGITNKIFIDIGKTGGHSLNGKITNTNDKVQIENYLYDSVIDLINYLGEEGWQVIKLNEIKILNETYYSYTLQKVTKTK